MFGLFTRPEEPEAPTWRQRLRVAFNELRFYVYTFVVLLLITMGFLWPRMFITVPSGHHAVMYRYFGGGTVTDKVWGEGFHIIPPWDRLTIYETRLQQEMLDFSVLSDEGLDLEISVSVRYRPYRDQLGYLHQDVGPEYFERLIRPEVEAHVRRTFGSRPAHEIYASARDVLQELRNVPMIALLEATAAQTAYIEIQEIKLVDIDLPDIVQQAIADRYRQEQLKLEYLHRIAREEQEAERKRIEAAGIRDYNAIASEISPDLLRWRDIEATRELASAPNSKVVVLGGGGDSKVPLMFNLGTNEIEPGPKTSTAEPPRADSREPTE